MEAYPLSAQEIDLAIQHLAMGRVIAYPTESVYGFGCDPFNPNAVAKLLELKQRPIGKGFILVGNSFEQIESLIKPLEPMLLSRVNATWPGPITWIFPASASAPKWITGDNNSIALRISSHPTIQSLCKANQGPIVSTSANVKGQIPATCANSVQMMFGDKVSMILHGKVGPLQKPTTIRDAITGEILRP